MTRDKKLACQIDIQRDSSSTGSGGCCGREQERNGFSLAGNKKSTFLVRGENEKSVVQADGG